MMTVTNFDLKIVIFDQIPWFCNIVFAASNPMNFRFECTKMCLMHPRLMENSDFGILMVGFCEFSKTRADFAKMSFPGAWETSSCLTPYYSLGLDKLKLYELLIPQALRTRHSNGVRTMSGGLKTAQIWSFLMFESIFWHMWRSPTLTWKSSFLIKNVI